MAFALLFALVWRFSGRLLRQYLMRRYTVVGDLPMLGQRPEKKIQGTALVCGGRQVQMQFIIMIAMLIS